MSERILSCIGNTCKLVKEKIPEIAGNSVAIASDLASLNISGAVSKLSNNVDHYEKLKQEMKNVRTLLSRLKKTISNIERRKYSICNLKSLKEGIKDVESVLKGYGTGDFKDRVYTSAWSEYYRQELSRSLILLNTFMNQIMMEVNTLHLEISLIGIERDPNERKKRLKNVQNVCEK